MMVFQKNSKAWNAFHISFQISMDVFRNQWYARIANTMLCGFQLGFRNKLPGWQLTSAQTLHENRRHDRQKFEAVQDLEFEDGAVSESLHVAKSLNATIPVAFKPR